jgi:glutathione S-transferase
MLGAASAPGMDARYAPAFRSGEQSGKKEALMPTIHGVNASPFVRKVRIAMEEKGLAYELEPVMPIGVSEEFKKLSPLGKIPVYQDGDYVLPDSSCIIAYLEHLHPEPPLYPSDAQEYGHALFLEEYADTRLVEALSPVFFQRVVRSKIMKQEPDESLVKEALAERIPLLFDFLETKVGDGDGIVGGRFSIADIGIGSPFVNFSHAGEDVDSGRWPNLASYLERIHSRPSFKSLIEEEKAAFSVM